MDENFKLIAIDELAKTKLPIVQKDFEYCFTQIGNLHDRIKQLHTFEITVVAGLIALLARVQTVEVQLLLAGLIFIFGIAVIEASVRANIGFLVAESLEMEALLSTDSPTNFSATVINWKFGGQRRNERTPELRLKRTYWAIRKPGMWLWHVLLACCLMAITSTA